MVNTLPLEKIRLNTMDKESLKNIELLDKKNTEFISIE